MQFIAITSVEGWDFAFIALPEVITLVLCVLRRRPVVFVGVVGVHFGGQDFTPVFLSDSGLSINEVKGWNDSVVRRKYTTTYLSSHWSLIPPCHHRPAKKASLKTRTTRWKSDWRLEVEASVRHDDNRNGSELRPRDVLHRCEVISDVQGSSRKSESSHSAFP